VFDAEMVDWMRLMVVAGEMVDWMRLMVDAAILH
jgi:hypothetical protein